MNKSKFIVVLFYFFPVFLFLQLAYGLVIREPYPSFIMPGFSRIETNASQYTLFDTKIEIVETSLTRTVDLQDLSPYYSKIAISMAIDIAFFHDDIAKNYNSSQKRYYDAIKKIIGLNAYQKFIEEARNPKMNEANIALFSSWILNKINTTNESLANSSIYIRKYELIKDFKTGELIQANIINEYALN
ncbi:MAG: hypothetical protein R2772_03435 [Chitinophagales bacterium]